MLGQRLVGEGIFLPRKYTRISRPVGKLDRCGPFVVGILSIAQTPGPCNELWRIIIAAHDQADDARRASLSRWLAQFDGLADATLQPAAGDASFRRYFRLAKGEDSYIVMDAPPPNESCRPFVTLAGYLESMGVNCPQILGADFDAGFVLMTDLGVTQYLDVLQDEPDRADALYADAISALLRLQENGAAYQARLPDYDAAFVELELSIFREWLCERYLGIGFSADDERHWQDCCAGLVTNALGQARVFMHRDYHSRNLMLTAEDNPGVLDFQDAVEGPLTYDIVSLLKDCYIKWPAKKIRQWALSYHAQLDYDRLTGTDTNADAERFMRQFDLMGMQRHLKAAGIFARLYQRDGKAGYLPDIPRTLGYVSDAAAQYGEFGFLTELIAERVLPALEGAD